MKITAFELSLLKIPVKQLQSCVEFYRDALGLELQFVAEEWGWAQFKANGLSLALYVPGQGGGDGHVGGSIGFHLALPEHLFEEFASELLQKGVLVDNQIHRGADGTTFIEVRDPDGNTLKIMRA